MTLEEKISRFKKYEMDSTWLMDMGHTEEEIEHYQSAHEIIDALQCRLAEQSAIISGKTFHDVQEATARECAKIVSNHEGFDSFHAAEAIRKKFNIKD